MIFSHFGLKQKTALLLSILTVLSSCESMKLGLGRTLTNKNKATLEQEASTGASVALTTIPEGWSKPFKLPMNDIWKELDLRGINYFTFGAPRGLASYSSRADFKSKWYQAWMGVYAVEAKKNILDRDNSAINRNPSLFIPELSRLAEHDQKAWLKAAGDPSPKAELIRFRRVGFLNTAGEERAVFEATMVSHSDLSLSKNGPASLFGRPKASYWSPHLSPYHDVVLKGYYVPWYSEEFKTVFVAYGNATSFKTKSGAVIDYGPNLENELKNMIAGVRIVRGRPATAH
jgi:hypothetical protein